MNWLYLLLAGVFEVAWAVGLKATHGFTRPLPTIGVLLSMGLSMGLLGLAVRNLPISTAYAVWTGIGTLGAALFGVLLYDEPVSIPKLACIGMIAAGIIGLKFLTVQPA